MDLLKQRVHMWLPNSLWINSDVINNDYWTNYLRSLTSEFLKSCNTQDYKRDDWIKFVQSDLSDKWKIYLETPFIYESRQDIYGNTQTITRLSSSGTLCFPCHESMLEFKLVWS